MVHEISFEIGGKPVMEDSGWVLVKLLLFPSGVCGHPKDGVMPSFFPHSKNSMLGLSFGV